MPNPFDVLNPPNIFDSPRLDAPSPFDHLNPPFFDRLRYQHTNRVPDRAAADYAGANLVGLFDPRNAKPCRCPIGFHYVGCPRRNE